MRRKKEPTLAGGGPDSLACYDDIHRLNRWQDSRLIQPRFPEPNDDDVIALINFFDPNSQIEAAHLETAIALLDRAQRAERELVLSCGYLPRTATIGVSYR